MTLPDTAAPIREVVVIHAGGELSPSIIRTLRDKRYTVRTAEGLDGIERHVGLLDDPIIVVEAGSSRESVQAAAKKLLEIAAAIRKPFLLIGDGAQVFERQLGASFPTAATLNIPYQVAEVLAALNFLSKSILNYRKSAQQEPKHTAEVEESNSFKITTPRSTATSLAEQLFVHLEQLQVLGKSLGGDSLAAGQVNLKYLHDQGMLPKNERAKVAIEKLHGEAGSWGGEHLARTSYVAQKTISVMAPEETLRENIKISAYLYAYSFAAQSPELLRQPYTSAPDDPIRSRLGESVRESALELSSLVTIGASSIVDSLARLLSSEEGPENNELSLSASAIMLADQMSRNCFQYGNWNPRRAYSMISAFRNKGGKDFHPAVLGCGLKILAEGAATRVPIVLLPKSLRKNGAFLAKLREENGAPTKSTERRVDVSQLVPGMRLARPLSSIDGQEILSPDLVLDEDLIWRVWQIAAIRPLKSAVIVRE